MVPVLLLTNDNALYKHWSGLSALDWAPVGGKCLDDLTAWANRGKVVLMDARLLPSTADSDVYNPTSLQIVVASLSPNDTEGQKALVSGAGGYIHAYMPVSGIDKVMRHVMSGKIWVGQTLLARVLDQVSSLRPEKNQDWADGLTPREIDVARFVAMGHSNQSIADSLNITERTVRAHVSSIFEKMGVNDRLMLALRVHGVKDSKNN